MTATSFDLWAPFCVAFLIALVATPITIEIAPRIGAMDVPEDGRRMHSRIVPRFGGAAIFLGMMVAMLIFARDHENSMSAFLGCCIIFVMGVIDDIKTLRPIVKLIGQIVAATAVYATGLRISFITNFFTGDDTNIMFGDIACFLCTVIWIVAITNAVNLIDGLDGLAAGICIISSLCIGYVAYIHGRELATIAMMIIAGSAMGFLPFNFHPAKTFMGDCGSQLLGFAIASFSMIGAVKGATIVVVVIPALVLGLPIVDTTFAIVRRLINHQPIGMGDKEHLHHRIMKAGYGQRRSVMLMYCMSGILGVVAVLYSRGLYVESAGLVAVAIMLLYVLLSETSNRNTNIRGVKIKRKDDTKNEK
ncbi:MAG: undecaprenyl/decaprenyl-phosphate alpha-N-acetylglucosaminyl 1-phosphate transferase [Firmicutes bacterium]|nr:undecaprenyl/decaprenyl-phosphate alpha-N-acetylglucosaminyl 1-phosphate transferase [Bacillota bacterium]